MNLFGGASAPEGWRVKIKNMKIDVRSPGEYQAGHVPGAMNIPLEHLPDRLDDLRDAPSIEVICWSGTRAKLAAEVLSRHGITCQVLAGGTKAWQEAGRPLTGQTPRRSGWSLERQIRLVIGLFVVLGLSAELLGVPGGIYFALFIGASATITSLLGICPMGWLLMKMPWNRR